MGPINNNKIIQLLIVAVFSLFIVSVANWLSRLATNPENEYAQAYQEKSQKGFLTKEELEELKNIEESYISDRRARSQRMRSYLGVLTLSMTLMTLFVFGVKYKALISLNALILGLTVFFVAIVVTSSVKQSILWLVFAFIGAIAAESMRHEKNQTR